MLPADLIQKIQQVYITSRYLANDVFAGEYETAFRGRGMEFEEVREYLPGDDIRSIDWNVTARMGRPFVKVFREEREQTVMLVVDGSASESFGSRRLKREVTAELGAVLAYAAIKSNDKVGLIIFTDRVERYIPPKKGRGHVWRVISEILSFKPQGTKTDLGAALNYFSRMVRRRSVCFVISDFLTDGFEVPLQVASYKHDVVALAVSDPLEKEFSDGGLISFCDLESGEVFERDLGSEAVRTAYQKEQARALNKKQTKFNSIGIDSLFLQTDINYIEPLLRFFRMREKRP